MAIADWRHFAAQLPPTPPAGADIRVPHRGMPAEVVEELKSRGYVPFDVRFEEDPEIAILQTIRGATRWGTIELSQAEISALRVAATIEGLTDKDRKRGTNETSYKDLDSLLDSLSQVREGVEPTVPEYAKSTAVATKPKFGQRRSIEVTEMAEDVISFEDALKDLQGTLESGE